MTDQSYTIMFNGTPYTSLNDVLMSILHAKDMTLDDLCHKVVADRHWKYRGLNRKQNESGEYKDKFTSSDMALSTFELALNALDASVTHTVELKE